MEAVTFVIAIPEVDSDNLAVMAASASCMGGIIHAGVRNKEEYVLTLNAVFRKEMIVGSVCLLSK
jgi:hypothetical protein